MISQGPNVSAMPGCLPESGCALMHLPKFHLLEAQSPELLLGDDGIYQRRKFLGGPKVY